MNLSNKLIIVSILSFFISACGGSEEDDGSVVVAPVVAPVIVLASNISADESTAVTLDGSESNDTDGTIVSYAWSQTSGDYNVNITNADQAIATFTAPDVNADSDLVFKLTITDNDGLNSTDTVKVTVRRLNEAPLAKAPANISAVGNNVVTLDGTDSQDVDGSIVSYEWVQVSGSPSVTLNNPGQATATFTAPNVSAELVFKLTVNDNEGASDSQTVKLQIVQHNNAPIAAISELTNATGNYRVILNGRQSSDSDGSITQYSWVEVTNSNVHILNANSSVAVFTAPNITTQLTFKLTVTDNNGATGSDTIDIEIQQDASTPPPTTTPTNKAPTAATGSDFNADENTVQTLNGSASSDSDGSIVSYNWAQTSGTSVSLTGANQAVASFTAPEVSDDSLMTFRLVVTDNDGATNTSAITVTVVNSDGNDSLTAVAANDFSADEDTVQTLNGSASTASNGTIVSYSWVQISGPTASLTAANQAVATFTAPSVDADALLVFQLTVTDNNGETDTDTITVTIENIQGNQAPVADTGSNSSATENDLVNLNGSASNDPDGTIVSYSWTQTAGSTVALNSPNAAIASFTAPAVASSTTLTFELSVTDNEGATDTSSVTITINPAGEEPEATGVATVSWTAPTENTDDSALTDLAGFTVYYGNDVDQLTNSMTVNSFDSSAEIENLLNDQTYYFAVVAFNDLGVESELSNISSKYIQ